MVDIPTLLEPQTYNISSTIPKIFC